MGFFVHAQTVDTRPLFPPNTWPGYEANASSDPIPKTIDHVIPKVGGAILGPGDLNIMDIK